MITDKKLKKKILLSSLFTLLPTILALFGYIFLFEQIDNIFPWKDSLVFTVILPIFIFVINLLCIFFTFKDNKNVQNEKVMTLVFSSCPFISIFSNVLFWAIMVDYKINVYTVMTIFLGSIFAISGNYLPKCKQNKTVGIKIKWTLLNEENWNATHRFVGKVWFFNGLALIISAFLPQTIQITAFISIFLIATISPAVFSYKHYKKQKNEGTWSEDKKITYSKKTTAIALSTTVVILIVCVVISFTGNIAIHSNENSIEINADYWSDLEILFSDIENVEYRTSVAGERISGFGTARLLLGLFKNEEFGVYTRYTYTQNKNCIVLNVKGDIKVINLKTEEETKELFEKIKANVSE